MHDLSLPMENYYEETLDIARTVKQNLPQFTSMAKVKPVTSQTKSLDIVTKASQNVKLARLPSNGENARQDSESRK